MIIFLASMVAACGVVDYSLRTENFVNGKKTGTRDIGTVYFHYADDEKPYAVHINRIKRGYAMKAPLDDNTDGLHSNFTMSRSKEYKYFVGIESRYAF